MSDERLQYPIVTVTCCENCVNVKAFERKNEQGRWVEAMCRKTAEPILNLLEIPEDCPLPKVDDLKKELA